MTVAPSSPSPAATSATDPAIPQAQAPETLGWQGLDGELRHRLERAAKASGMTLAAVCEQWLREGVERFETQQPAEDPDGSGRCSLRTGTSSLGPVPLPVQQSGQLA